MTPVTCGCAAGVVCPAATVTLAGEIVTLVVSLLLKLTVTPPAGAAVPRVTAKAADWVGPTVTPDGSVMVPGATTVTLAVVSGIFGKELAWIVVEPGATPVTVTVAEVALAATLTVAGTVAAAVLLELKLIVTPPAGAGADRVNVRFCVAVPIILMLVGVNAAVAATVTVLLEVV